MSYFFQVPAFYLALESMITRYNKALKGRAKDYFKSHCDKVDNNPFPLELQNYESSCKIGLGNYNRTQQIHLNIE